MCVVICEILSKYDVPKLVNTMRRSVYLAQRHGRRFFHDFIKVSIEDRSIPDVHDKWDEILERNKADFQRKLTEITQKHETDLKRMQSEYESKLAAMKTEHESKFEAIKTAGFLLLTSEKYIGRL